MITNITIKIYFKYPKNPKIVCRPSFMKINGFLITVHKKVVSVGSLSVSINES